MSDTSVAETWYEATSHGGIHEIPVIKETEKFVFHGDGRRESKDSEYHHIRKTFKEAKAAMIATKVNELDLAKRHVAYKEEQLTKWKALSHSEGDYD